MSLEYAKAQEVSSRALQTGMNPPRSMELDICDGTNLC